MTCEFKEGSGCLAQPYLLFYSRGGLCSAVLLPQRHGLVSDWLAVE